MRCMVDAGDLLFMRILLDFLLPSLTFVDGFLSLIRVLFLVVTSFLFH